MPNWVYCKMSVKGNKKELDRFIKFAKEGEDLLSANKFIPYPKKYAGMDIIAEEKNKIFKTEYVKDGFNSGGYEWCVKNWGTKWGINESKLVKQKNNELDYIFETAWSPPDPVIKKMSAMFPTLEFKMKWVEENMESKGVLDMKGGKEMKKMRA
jgi:hypothetical protein